MKFGPVVMKTAILGFMACFASGGIVQGAEDAIRGALRPVAMSILKDLEDQRQDTIAIGDFAGPPQLNTNYGPRITQDLTELLNELKPGVVDPSSEFTVRGRYDLVQKGEGTSDATVPDFKSKSGPLVARITAELNDPNGQLINRHRLSAEIRDNATIGSMGGISISFPPLASHSDRNDLLKKAYQSLVIPVSVKTPELGTTTPTPNSTSPDEVPPVNNGVIDGTIVRAKSNSSYGVEILAVPETATPASAGDWVEVAPREPRYDEGQVYVDLQKKDVYALKIHNTSSSDAAVFIEIDGQSVFAFSEARDEKGRPLYSFYTIESGEPSFRIVPGWHRNNLVVDSFLVTEAGKGASRLAPAKTSGQTGMIIVKFAQCWSGEIPQAIAQRGGSLETGFGAPVKLEQKEIKRTVGDVIDVVAIRYARD